MMTRVRQFVRALRARLEERDKLYIAAYLSGREQDLFYAMHVADQYHALQVAYTSERLAEGSREPLDRKLLIRSALLHDVGRKKGDLDIWGKVLAVLLHKFLPDISRRWAEEKASGFRGRAGRMMHVYYHHPEIGAEMLRGIGCLREAELAEKHHEPETPADGAELRILRRADGLN